MAYTTIDDPSAHFQIALYTGQGGTATAVTNDGNSDLQPDLIFFKSRTTSARWNVMDSTRGNTKVLYAEGNDAEATDGGSEKPLDSFNSDGFTAGESLDHHTNISSASMAAWQWKANGGTRTTNTESGNNPAGGYQANTTAGFSVVDYTGTGGAGTMAHGLGAVPDTIWVKNIDQSDNWAIYTSAKGNTHYGIFNTYGNWEDDDTVWNDTSPTSTVFTVGTSHLTNADGEKYLAYCFTNIQGYQKHGKYTGNGNADGPFVYTGFKPAYLWVKYDGNGENWRLYDNKRSTFNEMDDTLVIQDTNAEATNNDLDFLSNGFKLRSTDSNSNGSGATIYYYAVAEHPFVSSEGVPCTAR